MKFVISLEQFAQHPLLQLAVSLSSSSDFKGKFFQKHFFRKSEKGLLWQFFVCLYMNFCKYRFSFRKEIEKRDNSFTCNLFKNRGWAKIIRTDILLHNSTVITPRVKVQARGQNNWSRALKWGIVHLCSSNTFGNTTKFIKIWVFKCLRFCKKIMISLYKNAKNAKT